MPRKNPKKLMDVDFEKHSDKTRNKIALSILLVAVVAFGVFYFGSITGFIVGNQNYFKSVPTITSYYGSTPKIDGVAGNTEWADAGYSTTQYEGGFVKVGSKHDSSNLYFILQWQDTNPSWNFAPHFYFEQDGFTHDGILDGQNDYAFYFQGTQSCTDSLLSSTYSGSYDKWIEYGGSNAEAACSYDQASRTWTVEIMKPLVNNDLKLLDIQIANNKKPYSLGLAITNWYDHVEGGVGATSWQWPRDQTLNSASGSYTVPGDTATWGALNIVWTRKPVAGK